MARPETLVCTDCPIDIRPPIRGDMVRTLCRIHQAERTGKPVIWGNIQIEHINGRPEWSKPDSNGQSAEPPGGFLMSAAEYLEKFAKLAVVVNSGVEQTKHQGPLSFPTPVTLSRVS
jgi:hypothetical protein